MITREQILEEMDVLRQEISLRKRRLAALHVLLDYHKKPNHKGGVTQVAVEVMREATAAPDAATMGSRGGHARAASLDPVRRSEIARLAAAKRWGTKS